MSKILASEWINNSTGLCVGFVLIYNEHAGFKCYVGNGLGKDEQFDEQAVYRQGSKMPYEWAFGIFGKRMVAETIHLPSQNDDIREPLTIRYDGAEHKVLYK